MVIFIVTAVSNGANLTDGIDGLAAGTSAIIVATLALFAWVSGNIIFSDYLDVMFIPRAGELVVFIGAFLGALIGFLWYNAYPAQVFMGDTGSLTIGGIIAVIAIAYIVTIIYLSEESFKILFSIFTRYGDTIIDLMIVKEFVKKYPNKDYLIILIIFLIILSLSFCFVLSDTFSIL